MILSAEQLFSNDQVVNTSEASENYIDLGAAGTPYGGAAALEQDIGKGTGVPILVQVTGAITGTLVVQVQVDDNTSFSSAKTVLQHTFPATAPAGSQAAFMYVPQGTDERYMRLYYTGATAGTVVAGITMGVQTNP